VLVPETPTRSETSAHGSAVAVFESHGAAEEAVRTLAKTGFDMKKLSIVGRDYSTEEGVVGYYNAGDRMLRHRRRIAAHVRRLDLRVMP
jgi:hypothetical protein